MKAAGAIAVILCLGGATVAGVYLHTRPPKLPPVVAAPEAKPPPVDYAQQLAENFRANKKTELEALQEAAIDQCAGALAEKGAKGDRGRATAKLNSSGRLVTSIPFIEKGQEVIGDCQWEMYLGKWEPPDWVAGQKRLAELIRNSPPSPAIGMTAEQAEQTWWKRPERINRTQTARGTREQWVYSQGRYLYFENGILTAITDSR